MAFDAAGAGSSSRTPQQQNSADTPLQVLSQRVWTLVQTTTSITSLSNGIGGNNDTTALRQRIQSNENTGIGLQNEIDVGLRKLRVQLMSGADHSAQRQLKRLEDQHADVKARFVQAVNESRNKRRQFIPLDSAAAATEQQGQPKNARRNDSSGGGAGTGVSDVKIEMSNFTEVDAAITEERNAEALAIAREAASLHKTVQDLNALVYEQGEQLEVVESNVDKTLDKVVAGNAELEIAKRYQSSYRKKCVFFWFLFAGLVVTITVPLVLHYCGDKCKIQ